ncbi:MAG: PAS domain-containing sensor histidine kinase [Myxococcus sp.]|nr:PAS domain-containing sensor histidine kinase [Myxococcus sp.]
MPSSSARATAVTAAPPELSEFRLRLTALVVFRTVAATLILILAVLRVGPRPVTQTMTGSEVAWFTVVAVDYLVTLVTAIALRRGYAGLPLAWGQVLGAVAFATSIVLLTDNFESPFWFTYLLAVIGGSVVLGRKGALGSSVASAAATITISAWVHASAPEGHPRLVETGTQLLAQVLVAILSAYVAEQLIRARGQLVTSEEDLARTKLLRDRIVTSITSGLAVSEATGLVRFINPAGLAILGLDPTPPFPTIDALFPAVRAIRAGRRWESVVSTVNGDRILGISTTPLDESGSLLVVFQDLTDVRRKEDEMTRLDQLAELGRVSATLAHEVRNPLASMRGSAQMLLSDAPHGSPQERLSQIIVREADRLANLVDHYLELARPKEPQRRPVRVDTLVAETVEVLRADPAARGATIEEHLEPRTAQLDPAQIKQVLINLLRNAFRAAGPRGTVRVSVHGQGDALFEVWDSAGSVPPDELNRLFEPFYSREPDGTGLGLSTAQSIAHAHGARITVASSPSTGTTFCFMLGSAEANAVEGAVHA